ncbi:MAG TPA: alanine racemase [Baekduia sp.]|uniref:alanine racemase n=1 Tax=Baekduia sp. TaxID=2600305 RepID=UPI002D7977AB|nr:alanine racemase [Baekduia sp.]HET6505311.1 alanine racemase [Baekduia sp.]
MSTGPRTVHDLPTPALLVDADVLSANVRRMADHARSLGVTLRPHVKTHKSVAIARMQQQAGAPGFTVATLAEAEVLRAAGLDDLFVAYPQVGPWRAGRLERLIAAGPVAFGVDSAASVEVVARAARTAGAGVRCLWEVDSGAHRTGTEPGAASVDAVRDLVGADDAIDVAGFFTFPGHAYAATGESGLDHAVADETRALDATAAAAREVGLDVRVLSGGTTPTAWHRRAADGLTELRPGNYVFHDATQVALGVASVGQCALTVLATVIARPTPFRAVLDAGSKALGREQMTSGMLGYGVLLDDRVGCAITTLYEEHAIVESAGRLDHIAVGDRLPILPNHACVTANLHSEYVLVRGEEVVDRLPLDARGWAQRG